MDEPHRPPGAAGRWNDLGRRALSAAVLAPVALLCIWLGGLAFTALIALAGLAMSQEWVELCGARPLSAASVTAAVAVGLAALAAGGGLPVSALALLLAGSIAVWGISRRALLASGVLYVGVPMVSLLWLRDGLGAAGRGNVLFLVFVIWASDIGAYLVGRLVRGPKLAPSLSPGKTWSGAAGGLLAALLVGLFASGTVWAALAAVLLGVVCQAGDLLESGIKRHVGVKDSGRLIPGHGGLLDRLDGLLAAAPVAALVVLAGRGGQLWQ